MSIDELTKNKQEIIITEDKFPFLKNILLIFNVWTGQRGFYGLLVNKPHYKICFLISVYSFKGIFRSDRRFFKKMAVLRF